MLDVLTAEIDRTAPGRRPSGKAIGYQRWRSLLFMHWTVPVEAIRSLVPAPLDLDLYEGQAYLGIVPFQMEGVRPWWAPEAMAFRFLETNLRTYVVLNGRPGIYFLSLEAASWIAVKTARAMWGLPYYHASMRMSEVDGLTTCRTVRTWTAARHEVRYRPSEFLGASTPDTLEHFFLERYLMFIECGGRIFEGQVHHPPYPAQRVNIESVHDELAAAAGLPAASHPPAFAHFARGVDVEIFPLRRRV